MSSISREFQIESPITQSSDEVKLINEIQNVLLHWSVISLLLSALQQYICICNKGISGLLSYEISQRTRSVNIFQKQRDWSTTFLHASIRNPSKHSAVESPLKHLAHFEKKKEMKCYTT
jgi:hypothetical protein